MVVCNGCNLRFEPEEMLEGLCLSCWFNNEIHPYYALDYLALCTTIVKVKLNKCCIRINPLDFSSIQVGRILKVDCPEYGEFMVKCSKVTEDFLYLKVIESDFDNLVFTVLK